MTRSIALVGLSGSGKSTVARLLAGRLGWPWADTDPLIEALAGAPIPQIFQQRGEEAFRDLETQALREVLSGGGPLVLATGGGIVLRPENRDLLATVRVVWLDAAPQHLVARLSRHDEARPLLAGDPLDRLQTLRQQRASLYRAVASLRLDTTGLSADEVARRIRLWA